MNLNRIIWTALAGIGLNLGLAAGADAARPAWLTDVSLGLKESYDNNVFLSGVNNPPPYTVPAGSVAALPGAWSWITTVSPRIGVDFSAFTGRTNVPVLSLVYAPDFVLYHDQTSESHNDHRVLAALKADAGPVVFDADNAFTYVDGGGVGPLYPGGLLSGYAPVAERERRRQIQERAAVSAQFTADPWFIRAVASLLYYDMMTELLNNTVPPDVGYQNYCDRYDVNGGVDFGFKIAPQLALTLGYRYGHQYQEQYAFSRYSSPSDYQRVLFGLEGSPWRWLTVKIVSGPDFRNYPGDSATHTTPVSDRHPVKYFGEAQVTVTFAPGDTLTFKTKSWQWVSCLGKTPYYDSAYELTWHRALTDKLAFDLGGKILDWDFTSGNLTTCRRRDLQYTASAGLGYAINAHVSLTLAGTLNWGRNAEDNVADPQAREFNQQLVSLGTQWKF